MVFSHDEEKMNKRYFVFVFFTDVQELYLENNLIEEISEAAFNQSQSLNVISLRHNRLDETRIAPLAWFNHRSVRKRSFKYYQYSYAVFNM